MLNNITTWFLFLGSEYLEFEEFCILAARFLAEEEDEDDGNLEDQLKQIFRLYDKEGTVYTI